jgi:hypothetical protein
MNENALADPSAHVPVPQHNVHAASSRMDQHTRSHICNSIHNNYNHAAEAAAAAAANSALPMEGCPQLPQ